MARQLVLRTPTHPRLRAPRKRRYLAEPLEPRLLLANTLSVADASLVEGDSGTGDMIFTVTRTGDLAGASNVSYQTQDGTAKAGTDYIAQYGTAHFAAGSATTTIPVPILGNSVYQPNRAFTLVAWEQQRVNFAPQQTFSAGGLPYSTGRR